MMRSVLIIPVLLIGLYSPVTLADSSDWNSLSATEKKILKTYKSKWKTLSESNRRSLKTWAKISPKQWELIKKKYRQWEALSVPQRRALEKKIKRYKASTTAAKRVRLIKWQKWVNALPDDVRKKFKHAWKTMPPKDRRAYYLKLKKKYP